MHRRLLLATAGLWGALSSTLVAAQSPSPAAPVAVDLAGVRYPATVSVGGSTLVLNGAGIRWRLVVRVYTAGLYLAGKASTPEAVLAATGPKRMHVVMLRDIDGNDLGKLFTQGMEKNSPREIFAKSINGTIKMADLFSKRKKLGSGESFTVDWVPGTASPRWVCMLA